MSIGELIRVKEQGDDESARKKPSRMAFVILIAAIVALVFLNLFDGKRVENNEVKTFDCNEYEGNQEKRLEAVLKKINGAGDVSVYIRLDGDGEKILARDNKSKSSDKANEHSEESESNISSNGRGSDSIPFVTEEKQPDIAGVLVVATGASNERVRTEIYEAVRAIYGIPAHRIKITY